MSSGLEQWRVIDGFSIREYKKLKKWNIENGAANELTVRWKVLPKGFGLQFYEAGHLLKEEIAYYTDIVEVAIEAQCKLQDLIRKRKKDLADHLERERRDFEAGQRLAAKLRSNNKKADSDEPAN